MILKRLLDWSQFLFYQFQVFVESPALWTVASKWERPQGQILGLLSQGQFQRDVQNHREFPILGAKSLQAADALDEGALRGGGETEGQAARGGRQIQNQEKVSSAQNHLGRRGNVLLLQREVPAGAEGVVQPQPLPQSQREEGAGRGHGADYHAGVKLVQEPEAKGQGVRGIGVRIRKRRR